MKIILAACLCSTYLFLITSPCIAQADFKMATVDINRVLNESKDASSKKKTLDELSLNAKKKIETKKNVLVALEKKMKDGNVAEDSKELDNYRNEVRNFNRFVKDTEDDIKKEYMKINQSLTEKTIDSIRQYAKANSLDLILERSEKAHGPVLFGNPSVDITEAIIKQINK